MERGGRSGSEPANPDEGWLWSREKILAVMDMTRTEIAVALAKDLEEDIKAGTIPGEDTDKWLEIVGQLRVITTGEIVKLNPTPLKVLQSPVYPNQFLAGVRFEEEITMKSLPWSVLAAGERKLQQRQLLPTVNWWWQPIKAKDRLGDTPIEGTLLGWVGWLRNRKRIHEELLTVVGDTRIVWDDITQLALRAEGLAFKSYPAWVILGLRAAIAPPIDPDR